MENQDKLQEKGDQGVPVLSPGDRVWVCRYDTEGIVKQENLGYYFKVTTSNGTYTVWQNPNRLIKLCPVNSRKLWYSQIGQGLQKLCGASNHILNVLCMRQYTHFQYPFSVPNPTQLAHPVRVVTGLNSPRGIAFNSQREIIVSEYYKHRIVVLDIKGDMVRTFGSEGEEMIYPAGIAVDDMDNIYVRSRHKLQKFTSSGELIKCVGVGSEPGGVTLYNNQMYVCDTHICDTHNLIQVFDLDLNFIQSIGSYGKGRVEFYRPCDVKFDTDGYMYVAEFGNKRVQVLDRSGHFIRVFGEGELYPVALHIVYNYVYVCNEHRNIEVYRTSGQFVTSFGESVYATPLSINSCTNGFIYIGDCRGLIQIF